MFYFRFLQFEKFAVLIVSLAISACQVNKEKTDGNVSTQGQMQLQEKNPDALDSLQNTLAAFNRDSMLRNASFAYLIYDVTADSIIAERNPDISLVPASTIKLFTTAAALEILGPGTNYSTSLLYDGTIDNRVLKGNLIIKGGGDPTFCIGEQAINQVFSAWENSISKLNIDSITGNVIGDARFFAEDFIPNTWTLGEINMGYCAAPSGLCFNGNLFSLKFDPSKKDFVVPEDDELSQTPPNSVFLNKARIYDAEDELYLVGFPNSPLKTIRGSVRDGNRKAEVVGVIHDPAIVAAALLRKKLIKKGIFVSGKALSTLGQDSLRETISTKPNQKIASVGSPPVSSLVYHVNHYSNNFMAETLLKQLGVKKYGYGSTESGVKAVYNFLKSKGIDLSGFYMFDGSGISRYNAVTVSQLVGLLKYMQHSPVSAIFGKSLSVAGKSGTLSKIGINSKAAGNIQGKSGTMSRVKSYAGYARSRNNHQLVFAVIVNNFTCSSLEMSSKLEQVFIAMVAL